MQTLVRRLSTQSIKFYNTQNPNICQYFLTNKQNPKITGFFYYYNQINTMSSFKLTEVEGDLFSAPSTFSLAHCVAADLGMGAGIAIMFKKKFGRVDELKAQKQKQGGLAVLKDDQRFIYYLITKSGSYDKPTYTDLGMSLEKMRDHMRANDMKKLAIPRIGCGIDGLEWDKVTNELNQVFSGEKDVEIVVYNFSAAT